MRIARFEWQGAAEYGALEDGNVLEIQGSMRGEFSVGRMLCSLAEVRLLPPVDPRTVVGVGANYYNVLRAVDMDIPKAPDLFLKAGSCVIGHLDEIIYPSFSSDVRFEAELAVIMRKEARYVREDEALEYVLGYTCANDLTAHDMHDRFPTRNKSFYTSCPLGPWIVTDLDPREVRIRARLNGSQTQDAYTSDMVFTVSQLISYITWFMPLEPFDVILTGTSAKGVPIAEGDIVEVDIQGIGVLSNTVTQP